VLASNLANVETPGYRARELDFAATLRDAFEARAVINRHVGECAIEPGPVEEQRSAGLYVAKTLRARTEGGLTSDAESFHNRRGDRQGLGRHTASSPTHQLRYCTARQHARAHRLRAMGRRLTARCRRASSARTSASVPPPRANATSAM